MSLKAIELQVALPKTQGAGEIQELLQNRSQQLIEHASEQEKKSTRAKNEIVLRQDKNSSVDWNNHSKGRQQEKRRQNDESIKNHSAFSQAEIHPYKGKKIDFSG
jgi:hypothetical protein